MKVDPFTTMVWDREDCDYQWFWFRMALTRFECMEIEGVGPERQRAYAVGGVLAVVRWLVTR